MSFLLNLYVFGFWATGECHHSSLITGQDLAFASMTKHYKSYEKVSSFFKKFLSRHHIKIYKNITKSFEKYLLRISFLLFYCSHFRSAALLFYLKLPNTIPFSLPSNVKMAAWFGFLKMFWFTTCVLIFLYLLDLKLFFVFSACKLNVVAVQVQEILRFQNAMFSYMRT